MLHVNVNSILGLQSQKQMIDAIAGLAQHNCNIMESNFGSVQQNQIISICEVEDQIVPVSKTFLTNLYHNLNRTSNIIQQLLITPNTPTNSSQYTFLQQTWQKHFHSPHLQTTTTTNIPDRIDSLNKIICNIKQRTRNLMIKQQQESKQIWIRQYEKARIGKIWDNPMFQVMSQKINGLGMLCEDVRSKNDVLVKENQQLKRKYDEMETKISGYRDKMKKIQKQMFQISKKKVQLQKQLLQKQHNKASKAQEQPISMEPNKENKENETNTLNSHQHSHSHLHSRSHSQYILLLQEQQKQTPKTCIEETTFNSASIRDKYRHVKNLSRRSITYVSPNTSMDSIKSVKFQRTAGKKLILKAP